MNFQGCEHLKSYILCLINITFAFFRIVLNISEGNTYEKILLYIQQDATLHSLFYLETALHVSGGTTTHHQEGKKTVYTECSLHSW